MTGFKNIVATLYLKNGQAVKSASDMTVMGDVYNLCQLYNDSGIDKIIIFDLSTDDDEHEKNIHTIENINRNIDIKVCAGGNINRIEDVKKLLYAGCLQVIFNATKDSSLGLANVASEKFGKDKILLSISNVDYIFKHQEEIEDTFHELLVLNIDIIDALENLTSTPYVVYMPQFDMDKIIDVMKRETLRGIAGEFINDPENDIMALKTKLSDGGILVDNFTPDLKWSDLKLNSDGMVPVIVQDYRNEQVLMLAYMNKESMKKIITLSCLMLLCSFAGMAQKFALIDMEYILKNIPAYEMTNEQLSQVSKKWQNEVEAIQQEAQNMYKNYQSDLVFLSAEMKTKREEEIVKKEQEAQDLKRKYFGPEGELYKKRESLMKPIQDEVYNAVKEISEDKGYQIVWDRASAMSIIFASPKIDISNEVLIKLGYSK